MLHTLTRLLLLSAFAAIAAPAQELPREQLLALDLEDAGAEAKLLRIQSRADALTPAQAGELRATLERDPKDIHTRLVLLRYEGQEARQRRGEDLNPRAHGKLVLGLIEHHPESPLAGSSGLLLYEYKNDGLYTGPAWDLGIELWERLAAENPKSAAIATNAGLFLISDPFRLKDLKSQALAHLQRARTLQPNDARCALKLASYFVLHRSITRDEKLVLSASTDALPHLQAALNLTKPADRTNLHLNGQPLSMILAQVHFDVGDHSAAAAAATAALAAVNPDSPDGEVVFHMNTLLGLCATHRGDWDAAVLALGAAGTTRGSPILATSGPDLRLAKSLLAHGKQDAVVSFLEDCRRFWTSGSARLDTWIAAIRKGDTPW